MRSNNSYKDIISSGSGRNINKVVVDRTSPQRDYSHYSNNNDSIESLHVSDLDLSGISDAGHTDHYEYSNPHSSSPIKQHAKLTRGGSLPTISPSKPGTTTATTTASQQIHSKQQPLQNTCPICGEIYANYSFFLEHVYGASSCSEKYEDFQGGKNSKQASLSLFSGHHRHIDASLVGLKIEHVAIVVSNKDQYSFGGKNACTSIACEFGIQLLHGVLDSERPFNWNSNTIDKVVESGCTQDPKLGNLSFEEVMNINNRMSRYFELVHPEIQKSVKGPSFITTLETIEGCSHQMRRPLCAIFTKQPETVLVHYNFKTGVFLLADSHPRETDDLPHGASVLFTRSLQSMAIVLKKWLFPFMDFDETPSNKGLSELYNTFSCSIVKLRSGTEYREYYYQASKSTPSKLNTATTTTTNTTKASPHNNNDSLRETMNFEEETQMRDLMSELSSHQSQNDQLREKSQQNEEKIAKLKEKLEKMREKHLILKRKLKDSKELKKSLESIESIVDNISPLLLSDNNIQIK